MTRMIKKLKTLMLLLLAGTAAVQAQEAKQCFVNMPDSLCPLLTAVNRADFIDFLESSMKAEVTNNLGGKSEMTELAPDYLCVKVTPQSTWQMKLLPVNDSTRVICTVATVCAPACDSHIRFYTTAWQELPAGSYLPSLPVMADFLPEASEAADSSYTCRDAIARADMLLMKADLSAREPSLLFTLTTPDYMDRESAEKLKPLLRRPAVRYVWKEGSFVAE